GFEEAVGEEPVGAGEQPAGQVEPVGVGQGGPQLAVPGRHGQRHRQRLPVAGDAEELEEAEVAAELGVLQRLRSGGEAGPPAWGGRGRGCGAGGAGGGGRRPPAPPRRSPSTAAPPRSRTPRTAGGPAAEEGSATRPVTATPPRTSTPGSARTARRRTQSSVVR